MTTRKSAAILIAVAIAAGAAVAIGRSAGEPDRLVSAWQLTPAKRYRAMQVTDPFVSWAPDSRSLLMSAYTFDPLKSLVLWWKVGEKQLRLVTEGVSPNYMEDGRRFIYLKTEPTRLFIYDLATATEEQILPELTSADPWSEAKAFTYDPERRALALRLVDYTQFYLPGTEEYTLDGRRLGPVATGLGGETMAVAASRSGRYRAAIVDTQRTGRLALKVREKGSGGEREVAAGYIGAVDWSPDDDVLAYGDLSSVVLFRPGDDRKVVVARFGPPPASPDNRYVSRLKWSPNGDYLAVLVYVPSEEGDYPLIYVLNMSGFRWD